MSDDHILIIKHGALGDFIQATAALQAIRQHHPQAHISLLTTPGYQKFGEACPWIDSVILDPRDKWWQLRQWQRIRRILIDGGFSRVYDLQNTDRTGWYYRLLPKATRPAWSGYIRGCTWPHRTPHRAKLHSLERLAEQLHLAGIPTIPAPDVSFLPRSDAAIILPAKAALIIAGGAPHRPQKRWPAEHYGQLCQWLVSRGITPVLLGGKAEADAIATIAQLCPQAINMVDRTTLGDIAALSANPATKVIIGNDTGPMHIASVSGGRCIVLYSHDSDPNRCGQRGQYVEIIRVPDLRTLPLKRVQTAVETALT